MESDQGQGHMAVPYGIYHNVPLQTLVFCNFKKNADIHSAIFTCGLIGTAALLPPRAL